MKMHPNTKQAYELFHKGALAFCNAEQHGLRIDVDYCKQQQQQLSEEIEQAKAEVELTKFGRYWKHIYGTKYNFNSNAQLSHILYDVKKIKPVKLTDKGKGATDEEALSALNIPELAAIIKIRKLLKVRDTYLGAYVREQVNGILHPFFNLHLVKTYRSSSSDPNFQNIPKRDERAMRITRDAIFPRKGYQFVGFDFSGVETRIACAYTGDKKLIYDIIHGDMHKDMAIELYQLDSLDKHHPGESKFRQGAKGGFVFPEFYGDYYIHCAPNLIKSAKGAYLKDGTPGLVHLSNKGLVKLDKKGNLKNIDKFIQHVKNIEDDFWHVRYKTYTKWKDIAWEKYQKLGYVDLFTGFRCKGLMNKKDVTNYPFQGTAFHCLLRAFIEVDRIATEQHWDSFPVFQVHDEMICDTNPNELEKVAKTMHYVATEWLGEQYTWLNIPLTVEMESTQVDEPLSKLGFLDLSK